MNISSKQSEVGHKEEVLDSMSSVIVSQKMSPTFVSVSGTVTLGTSAILVTYFSHQAQLITCTSYEDEILLAYIN